MSRFEYLSVLVSIVIALALSELVQGWGALIRRRSDVRLYPLHLAWSVLVFLLMVQWWWGFWQYRAVESWRFITLIGFVSNAIGVALVAYVVSPGQPPEPDLRAHYWRQHRWLFGLAAAAIAELGLLGELLGRPTWSLENAFRAGGVAALGVLAWSRSERLHVALTLACYALFLGFVAEAYRPL